MENVFLIRAVHTLKRIISRHDGIYKYEMSPKRRGVRTGANRFCSVESEKEASSDKVWFDTI